MTDRPQSEDAATSAVAARPRSRFGPGNPSHRVTSGFARERDFGLWAGYWWFVINIRPDPAFTHDRLCDLYRPQGTVCGGLENEVHDVLLSHLVDIKRRGRGPDEKTHLRTTKEPS